MNHGHASIIDYTTKHKKFIGDLERKSKILNFGKRLYTIKEAIKDAAIFGMNDSVLKEKALAEDPDLEKLIPWGLAREAGKERRYPSSKRLQHS